MKIKFTLLLTAGILLPALCPAQPTGRGPAGKEADLDGDGFISKEEFQTLKRIGKVPAEKRDALFKRLDKDTDGKLSPPELKGLAKPHPAMKKIWLLDADKGGSVSLEEFQRGEFASKLPLERQKKIFKRLDTDGDGVISPKDKPQPEPPQGINLKLDLNQDGALSFEEFRTGPAMKGLTEDQQEDRFERLDKNKDQKLSPEDFPAPPPP